MFFNAYPFPVFVLILLFFLLMWFDRRLMEKGGWIFYVNKMVALMSLFGGVALIDNSVYSWVLMGILICYSLVLYLIVRKLS